MIGIKYVGEREEHHDNLYGTGLKWKPGQTHNVEDGVAAKMLVHTDTYEKAKPVKGEPAAEAIKPVETDKMPVPLPHLETMDKAALALFAQQNYGEQFDMRQSEASMRDKITTFIHARGR